MESKPTVLVLMGGQSNMAGAGRRADLPDTAEYDRYRTPPTNVFLWDSGWCPVQMGEKFGPEVSMAHALAEAWPDEVIGLVKHALGGRSMDEWHPEKELYQTWMGYVDAARASAPQADLLAAVWHQGESDSDARDVALAYRGKLMHLIECLRRDVRADLPVIMGQINPGRFFIDKPRFLHADIVREAQMNMGVPGVSCFSTEDLEKNEFTDMGKVDDIHYSGRGQIGLGHRFAEHLIALAR